MLRITTWRMNTTPQVETAPQVAFQTIGDMCTTLEKLPGAGHIRWFLGNGGIVTVGEPQSYAVADDILKSREAQAAVGKVLALGYNIVDDQFLLEPSQVLPFASEAAAVGARAS